MVDKSLDQVSADDASQASDDDSRFEGDADGLAQVDSASRGTIADAIPGRNDLALRTSPIGGVLHHLRATEPKWSPDGQRLAYGRAGVRILRLRDGDDAVSIMTVTPSRLLVSRRRDIVFRGEDGIWKCRLSEGQPFGSRERSGSGSYRAPAAHGPEPAV